MFVKQIVSATPTEILKSYFYDVLLVALFIRYTKCAYTLKKEARGVILNFHSFGANRLPPSWVSMSHSANRLSSFLGSSFEE